MEATLFWWCSKSVEPTAPNINLTRTIFLEQIYLLLKILLKICCNSFYLHPKGNLYWMQLSHGSPVNLLAPTFPNINLMQMMTNLFVVWSINLRYLHSNVFTMS